MYRASRVHRSQVPRGAKTDGRFFISAELPIQVSEQKKKNRIVRILQSKWLDDCRGALVLFIKSAQVFRQVEPRFNACQPAAVDRDLELANTLLLVSAWEPHEESLRFPRVCPHSSCKDRAPYRRQSSAVRVESHEETLRAQRIGEY